MKHLFKFKPLLKLDIQFLAEPNPEPTPPNPEPTPNPTPPPAPAPEKTFTQAEVDEMIRKRLARVKNEPPADYEDLKQKAEKFEGLENELNQLKEERKKEKIITKFKEAAKDADIEYVDAALKLADIDSFELDEEGNVKGLDEVMKKLVEENPFLKLKAPKEIGNPSNPGPIDSTKTKEQLLQEAADLYRRTGRPDDLAAYSKLKRELSQN